MDHDPEFRVARSGVYHVHRAMRTEILEALEPVLFGTLEQATEVCRSFEADFAAMMQQSFAFGVHSATIGLFLALRACGVGRGDEVITVGNSDISTTATITHCGAQPVLCEVLATDYTIDPDQVIPLINNRTRAILPVDLHGHPANVNRLREIADRHGLMIVEDAALASGAYDYDQPVGAFADAAVFSFARFKPLGSLGNGAMVTTNDEQIAQDLHHLSHYGHALDMRSAPPGHQKFVAEGYNVPLDPLQAAVLQVKLPHLPAWTRKRRAIAAAYAEGLRDVAVQLPTFRPESAPTFRAYTVRVKDRPKVYQKLRQAGIEVVLHYTPAIYRQPVYHDKLARSDLPVTEQLAGEIICLPVAIELDNDQVQFVIDRVRECVG